MYRGFREIIERLVVGGTRPRGGSLMRWVGQIKSAVGEPLYYMGAQKMPKIGILRWREIIRRNITPSEQDYLRTRNVLARVLRRRTSIRYYYISVPTVVLLDKSLFYLHFSWLFAVAVEQQTVLPFRSRLGRLYPLTEFCPCKNVKSQITSAIQ